MWSLTHAGSDLPDLRPCHLIGKVILTGTFSKHIPGCTVQPATKRIGVTERNRDDFHAKLVHLFHLVNFTGFHTNGFRIYHKTVHR